MSVPLSVLQDVQWRRLVQNRLRRVPGEEARSCQFYRWQPREILRPGIRDRVLRGHTFNPNRGFMAAFVSAVGFLFVATCCPLPRSRYATYDPATSSSATTAGAQASGG